VVLPPSLALRVIRPCSIPTDSHEAVESGNPELDELEDAELLLDDREAELLLLLILTVELLLLFDDTLDLDWLELLLELLWLDGSWAVELDDCCDSSWSSRSSGCDVNLQTMSPSGSTAVNR
jgi:hypothetical protein